MGTGKYYDCVICKRGFTTAQALGGHMNIHKKDRPSKKPPRSIKVAEMYLNLESYPSIHRWHSHFYYAASQIPPHHQVHYLAGPSRTTALLDKLTYNAQCYKSTNKRGRNLFGTDWRPDWSLFRSEPSHICPRKRKMEASSTEENELDLELRLGQHP